MFRASKVVFASTQAPSHQQHTICWRDFHVEQASAVAKKIVKHSRNPAVSVGVASLERK
jgi:hypothetical protein